MNRQSARLEAESRNLRAEAEKLNAEQYKLVAEQYKLEAEKSKLDRDKMLSPWLILAQGLIAGAALMGAGVALAKLLIS
ncbi:hypothetical protein [uncultured Sphingomonas sp.]|uniref:hypothetical protein n=1 Tax=uncultured Sphingomonas sp. TaxID=158754 RepID=UPI0035C9CB31